VVWLNSPRVEIPEQKSKRSFKVPKVSKQKPVQKTERKKTTISPELSNFEVISKFHKRNTSSRKQELEDISKINNEANLRRSSRQRRPNVNYTD